MVHQYFTVINIIVLRFFQCTNRFHCFGTRNANLAQTWLSLIFKMAASMGFGNWQQALDEIVESWENKRTKLFKSFQQLHDNESRLKFIFKYNLMRYAKPDAGHIRLCVQVTPSVLAGGVVLIKIFTLELRYHQDFR